jgi:hypothetical protein
MMTRRLLEMCNFWTCIITRDLKVLSSKSTSSHEALIKKAKLKEQEFV